MPAPGVTTLGAVRATCQQRTDMVNSNFVSTAEWNGYIQSSYQELYGIVTQAFGNDYFTQTPNTGYLFTTDGINQFFTLPADFFKLLGVDVQISAPGYWATLKQFAFADRNRLALSNTQVPAAGQQMRVFYVPRLVLPTLDADPIDGVNGWEEYIVADVCIKASGKEESDTSTFKTAKTELLRRLDSEVENRNAGAPACVVDVDDKRTRAMMYRLNGSQLWLIGNSMPGWGIGDWGSDGDLW